MSRLIHRARKVDANQAEIVKTFRCLGYSVHSTATIGKGFPDIIVGKYGENFLIEIKDGSKPPSQRKKTKDEIDFFNEWLGNVYLIESIGDVLKFNNRCFSEIEIK